MKTFSFFVAITLLFTNPFFSYSQQNDHPKIGVVLSGGGAKGIAHVGILKALEEEGIRPDFIVGTSMGSIIGGLYAAGYSANQLDSIIRKIDWDLVLSNNIPFNYISFEEKEYYSRFLVSLSFEDGKLSIPSGMIEGQMLSMVLSRYTWPAMKYDSFDDFPIPFRCVATDVSSGKPIVFKDGSLAEALRASMSIPTVFTAADLDTTLAVDGGVLNNFPVEEAIKLGADYIIGVNVSDEGLTNAKELGSMAGILMQVAMFPSLKKVKNDIEQCDIYIKPDLKEYSTGSFSSYDEILKLGYKAGEKARAQIHDFAEKINAHNTPPSSVSLNVKPIYISKIELRGNKYVSDKLILGKLTVKEGEKVSREDIETGINRVYGINDFKKVLYKVEKIPNENRYNLIVNVVEKQPASINSSVHYDNLFSAGLVLNVTIRNLLGKSSRFIAEGDISASPKARISYLKYLGKRERIAGLAKYSFLNEEIPNFDKGQLTDIGESVYHEFIGGFLVTQSLKNSALISLRYKTGREKLKFWTGFPDGIKNLKVNQFIADANYNYNTLNNKNYPTSGAELGIVASFFFNNRYYMNYQNSDDTLYFDNTSYFDVTENSRGFTEPQFNDIIVTPLTPKSYGKLQLKYQEYIKMKPKFQLIPQASIGLTVSTVDFGLFDNFKIGGSQMVHCDDVPLYGLNYSELGAENFIVGGLSFQNVLFRNIFLKYGANFLLHHQYVPIDNLDRISFGNENALFGYGMKVTYKSLLGPVSVGLSSNTKDNYLRWYVGMGFSLNYKD